MRRGGLGAFGGRRRAPVAPEKIEIQKGSPGKSLVTTSHSGSSGSPPAAFAEDGVRTPTAPNSPALSDASTADGEEDDDLEASPILQSLPAPRLPGRAQELLRQSPTATDEENQFGTASWGSPYPRTDRNLRQQSFSSEGSEGSPIHQLAIDTRFLRPVRDSQEEQQTAVPANPAADVLANRARRLIRGLSTEDWIRTHTTGDLNIEPRHWFSDGSESEHSSLSGSENGWLDERDPRTPKAPIPPSKSTSRSVSRHPRGRSSIETLKAEKFSIPREEESKMEAPVINLPRLSSYVESAQTAPETEEIPRPATPTKATSSPIDDEVQVPTTPTRFVDKPLPKEPPITPRIKKKVPWKGKNIMVLLPRDDERGLPGNAPRPLRQDEIQRMYSSWRELGYGVEGFDLVNEGYQPSGLGNSQSCDPWPTSEDLAEERTTNPYPVALPDLNSWRNYVNELQEAKLRALGVFLAEDEPPAPPSPPMTNPSRQPSVQYPPLPFSPPIPTSSASSNVPGFPFHMGPSAAQSPGIPGVSSPLSFNGGPGKFNPRQSVSFPTSHSPFQQQSQWMQGGHRSNSPSMANLSGMMSPQSPFGFEGYQPTGSPAFNMHQRHQSLQYPMLQHQQFMQQQQQHSARASPRLQEVREDEEDEVPHSASKTPEASQQNPENLQAEIDDAEYHLEEQLREQLEHEDYNPQASAKPTTQDRPAVDEFEVPEHFAKEPEKPLVLHHPRPHSRGHSITQSYYRDQGGDGQNLKPFSGLNEIPEAQKVDESYEIETNPSNLRTPVQNLEFSAAPAHQKTASTTSHPWNDEASASKHPRPGHGSKPSFSKLNVKAPEFKFNPTSSFTPGSTLNPSNTFTPGKTFAPASTFTPGKTFTPGQPFTPAQPSASSQFHFSGQSFQPTVFQAGVDDVEDIAAEPVDSADEDLRAALLGKPGTASVAAPTKDSPSFAPAKSIFSFSASGPKFRPDAPAFTPSSSLGSSAQPVFKHGASRDSIFDNISLDASRDAELSKESKAVPIIAPSNTLFVKAVEADSEDEDGRPQYDESRVKRAWSEAPDGDSVPLFAEQPKSHPTAVDDVKDKSQPEEDFNSGAEGDQALPADTSMSSAITSDQIDTKATTAAPSEVSPTEASTSRWEPFEFRSDHDAKNFNSARPFGEESFIRPTHKKSLSAAAPAFTPGAMSFGSLKDFQTLESDADELEEGEIVEDKATTSTAAATPVMSQPESDAEPRSKRTSLGLGASRFASPPPRPKGLAASRFAVEPSPEPEFESDPVLESVEQDADDLIDIEPRVISDDPPALPLVEQQPEMSFEDIDAVMQHLENDPSKGVKRMFELAQQEQAADVLESPSFQLEPPAEDEFAPGTFPRDFSFQDVSIPRGHSTELEDPFIDPIISPRTPQPGDEFGQAQSPAISDWEGAFSEDEHDKLESRAQFFDNRVNEVVDTLLASRLYPLEKTLASIQGALSLKPGRPTSSRRDIRSVSGEMQESDADDEDEEPVLLRSMSPRRDRKFEHIRAAVLDGFAQQQRALPAQLATEQLNQSTMLQAIEEIKQYMTTQAKPDFAGDDLRTLIEDAVQSRVPPAAKPDEELLKKMEQMQSKMEELEDRLRTEQAKVEKEVVGRRTAEDSAADLHRQLQAAETRVEVEIINRSVFDQRVTDLEERLRHQESQTEQEVNNRRSIEDRLAENQRLLHISSEEENHLREQVEEKEQKVRHMEQSNGKTSMKMALLEAAQNNSTQSQTEMTNKLNVLEADLRNVRQDNTHWRSEAERSDENARRNAGELGHVLEENKHLQKSLYTISTQMEENERLRESWRSKFFSLQDDMSKAAREIAEENARRIKKDQAMLARQEVLDARLQAEAKTRERLEVEMDRLQMNERSGMRATNECTRLEGLLGDMRTENHKLQQRAMEAEREFEEARESGLSEVKRTRMAMQIEIDSANHQVNVVREELEEQNTKLRSDLDNFKLDADTIKVRNDMLLEEAQTSKSTEVEDLRVKQQNEMEDMQARHEQQRTTAADDAHKSEQNLLERLSLSSSRIEHLQDRVLHLEEKLEISKEAAAAAAAAAKSAGVDAGVAAAVGQSKPAPRSGEAPEKISPQALRESIMVLQEQLQAREQRIEELEQTAAKSDPDAANKIMKRDDEISWLRELLTVRHGELQDIIAALQSETFDRMRIKDAVIRLKANLQMEQQERERAMNGGSALSLPNIAQTLQSASPRVAQTIGPIAAAWGSWRRGNSGSISSMSGRLNSPSARTRTPSKSSPAQQHRQASGLMTPPASTARQFPVDNRPQPTAFSNTGRRYPSQGSAVGRDRGASNSSVRQAEKMPTAPEPSAHEQEEEEPVTPPMMRPHVYDDDAQSADFDDDDFFEED